VISRFQRNLLAFFIGFILAVFAGFASAAEGEPVDINFQYYWLAPISLGLFIFGWIIGGER